MRELYLRIGMHAAPPGTILYFVHRKLFSLFVLLKKIKSFFFAVDSVGISVLPDSISRIEGGKICILKLDHIGDFFVALDAIGYLKKEFNKSEFTLICHPSIESLAESSGLFDRVIPFVAWPTSDGLTKRRKINQAELISKFIALPLEEYFLAVDLRYDPDSRFYLDYIRADYRAGFQAFTKYGLDVTLPRMEWDVSFAELNKKNLPPHSSTRLKLLCCAIVAYLRPSLTYELAPYFDSKINNKTAIFNFSESEKIRLGICVGAGAETRQWATEYWLELLLLIIEESEVELYFFGGKNDFIESQKIMQRLPACKLNDYVGKISLDELPLLFQNLDVYIGGDTGLTHLAAGLGVKTINIYPGVSNISVWSARGANVKTIYANVPCAPCHLRYLEDCWYQHKCMSEIKPLHIYEQFLACVDKDL